MITFQSFDAAPAGNQIHFLQAIDIKETETILFLGFEYKRREFTCQEGFAGPGFALLCPVGS